MSFGSWLLALTWQLPQTLLGLFVAAISSRGLMENRRPPDVNRRYIVYIRDSRVHCVLGPFIILPLRLPIPEEEIVLHDWGHTRQSRRFGPLYLFVVSIPSLIRWSLVQLGHLSIDRYYGGWPEKHADILGGVSRPGQVTTLLGKLSGKEMQL